MIDWTGFNKKSPSDWTKLATRLVGQAQTVLSTLEPNADDLRAVQTDLGELVQKANLSCPDSVITAARRASDQITVYLASLAISDLERRNDRLDAVKARLSSATNELRADSARLALGPVQNALASAAKVKAEIDVLTAEVGSLTKAEIPDKLSDIAKQAMKVIKELENGIDAVSV